MAAALGALHQLVGVTHECDHPAEVRARPRVTRSAVDADAAPSVIDAQVRELSGSGAALFALDESAITELRPTLLLTQALCDVCAVSEDEVRALARRLDPPPAVVTLGGSTLDAVLEDLQRVGAALGLHARADALVLAMRERMRAVHERLEAARAPRPRVAVLEWTAPPFVAGHWVPEMVHRAGGIDVLGAAGAHSPETTIRALAAADPEIVVVAPCGYPLARAGDEARQLLEDPAWRPALAGRAVWAVDANALVSRPGPRLVEGVETFARVFNPALFADDATRAMRVG
jgi:iron complex transport system substrate-binding protein